MNIFESVIDQSLENYSKFVFDEYKIDKPRLKDRIRQKILDDVNLINKKISVVDFFIKGSILTKQYTTDSDIDIFVQVNSGLYTEDQLKILLKPIWDEIDETYIKGVPHPFQYYITKEKYNPENTEAMYDVNGDNWIKRSSSKSINLDEYMDDFKDYVDQFSDFSEELRRNMIDYEILKDIPTEELSGLKSKLNNELRQINNNISDLSEVYDQIRDMRDQAFSKDMTPSEIKKYGIKTRLPGNVVFKLLERYYYLDLYKKIKSIIGDDNKLSHNEVDQLNSILKTRLTSEKTSFKNIFKGKLSTPRHMSNKAGLTGQDKIKKGGQGIMAKCHKTDPNKNTVKPINGIIRVKQGTPEAIRLAKKYRIADPRGKKIVDGNQYTKGVTIIFEETLEQKVKRAQEKLNNK